MDDDLIYPPDYSERTIAFLESMERKIVVTLHGRYFKKMPLVSYDRDKAKFHAYRCLNDVNGNDQIHVGGTGVMLCHTDTLKLSMADFNRPNMADIWMSMQAAIQEVPIYCVEHKEGCLIYIESMRNKYTIYDSGRSGDIYQTEVVNAFNWPDI